MTYRFQLHGNGLRHSWHKDCARGDALHYAELVARECARDRVYDEVVICVTDGHGAVIATVPVAKL